ncbi:MAG: NUDIX domain-containing protein [Nanoarchaeota archaeon]
MNVSKQFIALKAVIEHNGKVLILRESKKYEEGANFGKYDICGGRLKVGENWKQALEREVEEETSLKISIKQPFYVGEWYPMIKGEQCQIIAIFFKCSLETKEIKLSADHDHYEWITPEEYEKYNLIPNLKPMFEEYLKIK